MIMIIIIIIRETIRLWRLYYHDIVRVSLIIKAYYRETQRCILYSCLDFRLGANQSNYDVILGESPYVSIRLRMRELSRSIKGEGATMTHYCRFILCAVSVCEPWIVRER